MRLWVPTSALFADEASCFPSSKKTRFNGICAWYAACGSFSILKLGRCQLFKVSLDDDDDDYDDVDDDDDDDDDQHKI